MQGEMDVVNGLGRQAAGRLPGATTELKVRIHLFDESPR